MALTALVAGRDNVGLWLSWEDRRFLSIICGLRIQGYGYQRIARFLQEKGWFREKKLRSLAKWVERYLKRWMNRLGVSCAEELNVLLKKGIASHVFKPVDTNATFLCDKPVDSSGEVVETTILPPDLEGLERLGYTEKLVLSALFLLNRATTPSLILAEIRRRYPVVGYSLSRKAVWAALQRLVKRGLVRKLYHVEISRDGSKKIVRSTGYYALSPWVSEQYFVENFFVDGEEIWTKKNMGYPLPLRDALGIATLRGKTYPVSSIEIKRYFPEYKEEFLELKNKYGVTYICMYPDDEVKHKPNIEVRYNNTPIDAHITNYFQFLKIRKKALKLAYKMIKKDLETHL